ncbi:E3 ubiquitin ligase BIG BROTHER-related-like [Cornus florida]|uniref:E3 ubiquitin ligase BIG BROTHER-related-like n=1 Tax=Cornus florida TaxID=4283 RepID=UPI00289C82DA|nr:E3 ubiquitin ligase BIG BROTHER-related-like [Cornus florida]
MFEDCCKDDGDEHDDQPCEYGSEVVGRLEIAELSDADSRASQVQEQGLTDDQESLRKNLSNTGACFSYQESDFWDILCTLKCFLDEPIATYETKVLKQIGLAVVDMCLVCMHGFVKGTVFATSQCVPPADMCPICLQGFLTGMMVSMTPCSHSFHRDCLSQWLSKTNSCPMCRSLCTGTTGFTVVYL